jgi:isopentenyl-diphosphate delta-isomerase
MPTLKRPTCDSTDAMQDGEELVVLVDSDDNVVGSDYKLATHRAGALHRAFSVIIWDNLGRLLLQKRNVRKYHSGGLWTNACCGHPRPDEDVATAASRRLEEEMGFTCTLEALGTIHYRAELDKGMIEHELVHVFRGLYDGMVAPDYDEVESYRWSRLEDVRADISTTPEHFTAWFRKYVAAKWPMTLGG